MYSTDIQHLAVALENGHDIGVAAEPLRSIEREPGPVFDVAARGRVARDERRLINVDDDLACRRGSWRLRDAGDPLLAHANERIAAEHVARQLGGIVDPIDRTGR